eukprot:568339-Prymnesium_polylepis.3
MCQAQTAPCGPWRGRDCELRLRPVRLGAAACIGCMAHRSTGLPARARRAARHGPTPRPRCPDAGRAVPLCRLGGLSERTTRSTTLASPPAWPYLSSEARAIVCCSALAARQARERLMFASAIRPARSAGEHPMRNDTGVDRGRNSRDSTIMIGHRPSDSAILCVIDSLRACPSSPAAPVARA